MDGLVNFIVSTCVTVFGLFAAGAMNYVTGVNWLKSGMEMLAVGFFAFSISYVIGLFIPGAGG